MSRSDPQFNLRIPQELRDRVMEAAKENKRSATAEIIARLEQSFAEQARLSELAEYEEWRKENPTEDADESIVLMLSHLRHLISSAEQGLKKVERLYDEKTGEHALVANEDGTISKSYEK